jgi:hypothetical protein
MLANEWKLSVTLNLETGDFDLKVEPDNVFVGLSLAGLADRVLRRIEARAEAASVMQNAPRVFPGGAIPLRGRLPE